MMFDTHCHIYLNKNLSVEEILLKMKQDNISKIVCIGIDIETSKKCIELAKKYPGIIYATVGIHPTDIKQYFSKEDEIMNIFEKLVVENLDVVVGVGESGFDYHWIDKDNFESEQRFQKDFFVRQIKVAKKFCLPLILHSRNSKDDTLQVLKEYDFKNFILHCYSEDLDFAYKAIYFSDICKISFSGILTYKSATNIHNVAANIPLERILVETDSPYLAPQIVRGTENNPCNVKYIIEKIYELRKNNGKKESLKEIQEKIYQNSLNVYQIDN